MTSLKCPPTALPSPIAVPRAPPIAIDTGMRGGAREPDLKKSLSSPNPGTRNPRTLAYYLCTPAPELQRNLEKSQGRPGGKVRFGLLRTNLPAISGTLLPIVCSRLQAPNLQAPAAPPALPLPAFAFPSLRLQRLACVRIPSQKAFPHAPRLRYCATAHRLAHCLSSLQPKAALREA